MKTSISISDSLLKMLLENSQGRSRNEAIQEAIVDFVARKQREKAAAALGTFSDFMTRDELQTLRGDN